MSAAADFKTKRQAAKAQRTKTAFAAWRLGAFALKIC
jgi:hypothetical protein